MRGHKNYGKTRHTTEVDMLGMRAAEPGEFADLVANSLEDENVDIVETYSERDPGVQYDVILVGPPYVEKRRLADGERLALIGRDYVEDQLWVSHAEWDTDLEAPHVLEEEFYHDDISRAVEEAVYMVPK